MMQNKRLIVAVSAAKSNDEKRLLIHQGYMKMLIRHGAMPVLLPMTTDETLLHEIADLFDGFVFSGGGDVDSAYWGEELHETVSGFDAERDTMEIKLLRILHEKKDKPVLGICRGEQVMNVALGGSLIQDIPSMVENAEKHSDWENECGVSHKVEVLLGTMLADIVGIGELGVNTLHHQAVRDLAPALMASAVSPDHVIEAVESCEHPFFMGVQWHPERLGETDSGADSIFKAFCEACAQNAR